MNILFHTLGCRVNQAESGGMEALLRDKGHFAVSKDSTVLPDAVIVNTCTVTASADTKSKAAIRRLRRQYPQALLCVCGCLSQTDDISDIAGIDLIGGSGTKSEFISALEALADEAGSKKALATKHSGLMQLPGTFDRLPNAPGEGRTRVFIKIQDGCHNHCSYCKIPAARGTPRSLPLPELLESARGAANFPEVVLCGIEISSYTPSLVEAVEGVCRILPGSRVRVSSLEPRTVNEDFCRRLSALKNLCPHFHLSLQSCCREVLRRMNRHYTPKDIENAFALLRGYWSNPAVTADILAGFPGESDQEFDETVSALNKLAPAGLHVFPYSKRKGTPAANFPGQLTRMEKSARAEIVIALGKTMRQGYLATQAGKKNEVLFEGSKNGVWHGYTPEYIPVYVESREDLRGKRIYLELGYENMKNDGFYLTI
ncbi:MAG: MiaB/RimO family radical SAM methylthiotransferase [Oscillospiraceae bacterium]|nr:MiaB/RimO family radical SAM methylthiotransferase [Oscillospiraceae bacterium]